MQTRQAGPSGRQPPPITRWSALTASSTLIRPKSPKAIQRIFKTSLTKRQKLELAAMDAVWFFTLDEGEEESRGGVANGGYDDDDNNYILVQNEHFYYRFELNETIGHGGQGVVVQCLDHKTRTMVALKILASPSNSMQEENQLREMQMSMELQSHRSDVDFNVARVLETFSFRGHKCLVMELLSTNLHWLLRDMGQGHIDEDIARAYTRGILRFLAYAKSRGIVHGDIKLGNILVKNIASRVARVTDFGFSFFVDRPPSHVGGTLVYVAPEVLLGYPVTCAADTWSLGCTVAKMATGRDLFLSFGRDDHLACCIEILGMPPKEMVERSRNKEHFFDRFGHPLCPATKRHPGSIPLHFVLWGCGAQLVNFIRNCLHWDPELRMTPEQALAHGWLQSDDTASPSDDLPTTSWALPTTSRALPTTSHALPTTSRALPTTSQALPTTSRALPRAVKPR
ncbi:dual specificity tyrosine-phosphorylation-regulated kinase 2-like isoform X2 [Petromyzon marinus]|uniref:dual specificity tyrosine-phosphorylation-regulated kinase 2-like isoform X2 n=1 Tax=Petromyzon marinus TaxID=7757 RepID=UPI003F7119B5